MSPGGVTWWATVVGGWALELLVIIDLGTDFMVTDAVVRLVRAARRRRRARLDWPRARARERSW